MTYPQFRQRSFRSAHPKEDLVEMKFQLFLSLTICGPFAACTGAPNAPGSEVAEGQTQAPLLRGIDDCSVNLMDDNALRGRGVLLSPRTVLSVSQSRLTNNSFDSVCRSQSPPGGCVAVPAANIEQRSYAVWGVPYYFVVIKLPEALAHCAVSWADEPLEESSFGMTVHFDGVPLHRKVLAANPDSYEIEQKNQLKGSPWGGATPYTALAGLSVRYEHGGLIVARLDHQSTAQTSLLSQIDDIVAAHDPVGACLRTGEDETTCTENVSIDDLGAT